jgi:diadenosine tetraphosphate (Ap4A) HIT family hydrolase
MEQKKCFFCSKKSRETIITENELFYARLDDFPVSEGHIEIVPIKHIESFFDLNNQEIVSLLEITKISKNILQKKYNPDSFNIGINN